MATFNVCVIGAADTGKSTWVKRIVNAEYEPEYNPTIGVEVYPVKFETNHGTFTIHFWDTAGNPKFGGLREGYYKLADGAIYFRSKNHQTLRQYREERPGTPMCMVTGKADLPVNKLVGFPLSSRSCLNLYKPVETLLRKFTGYEDLKIVV